MRFWAGPALTAIVVAGMALLWQRFAPEAPIVASILAPALLSVSVATLLGGWRSGAISAALVTLATIYVYLSPAFPSSFDGIGIIRFTLVVSCTFANVAVVGALKARMDRLQEEQLERERAIARAARIGEAHSKHAADMLRANNETLETMVYVITHDLKEPVRAIDHHLDKAQQNWASKTAEEDVARARDVNHRLGALLQRLLEYSRASLSAPRAESIDVAGVVNEPTCRVIYEHALLTRGARLEFPRESHVVSADRTLLAQALGNLILNAIKHNARPDAQVTILTRPRGALVTLLVQDNGPGFPPSAITRLNSLRPGRPATIGGGFGLVIARRAIERSGGTMRISNLHEGGACVTIELPAGSPETAASDSREVPLGADEAEAATVSLVSS